VCLNLDGVLLPDTFSPVIHRLLAKFGVEYTPELERLMLSQPREVAGSILASAARLPWTWKQAVHAFFEEREEYLADNPLALSKGTGELIDLLREKDTTIICYGGMDRENFDEFLWPWRPCFAEPEYISTNDTRPGIKEILHRYGVAPSEALFVDDVNRFAEFARHYGVGFVGMPTDHPHSFQREQMVETGVRHLVWSLPDIDDALLAQVDQECAAGTLWR
jgi:beta-phosphoglucomutase-like phosphatase (HAD superfamily)